MFYHTSYKLTQQLNPSSAKEILSYSKYHNKFTNL
jgi:hypothetical protein